MSTRYESQGEIHSMGETTEYGNNGFTKREFVIKVTGPDQNPTYPNYLAFELIKDRCALIDQFAIGAEIKVHFNLNGRLWQAPGKPERCFNALQAWRIEALSAAPQPDAGYSAPAQGMNDFDDSDVPF